MAKLFDTRIFSVIGVNSALLSGAKLYWYIAGTTTATDTFSDPDMTTANANPVLADANGRFPAIWLAEGDYKYILTSASGSPASPIITQDDFRADGEIPSFDAGLLDFLAGNEPLDIANGGTGQTSAANAIAALGGLPTTGGTMTGNIVRNGQGVHHFWITAALNSGGWALTPAADSDPTTQAGQVWAKY